MQLAVMVCSSDCAPLAARCTRAAPLSSRPHRDLCTRTLSSNIDRPSQTHKAMSSPAASSSTVPAVSRKRGRGDSPLQGGAEEERVQEEAAAAQPPSSRLYKHALESIFAFLDLKGLSSVLAVSRLWSSAVVSMRAIDAAVESPPVGRSLQLIASRLARHIGTLGSRNVFLCPQGGDIGRMSKQLGGVHTLYLALMPPPAPVPVAPPPSLVRLTLRMFYLHPKEANEVLKSISRLSQLRELKLYLRSMEPQLSFAPLRDAPQLQELSLSFFKQWKLNSVQADELRALPHLTSLDAITLTHNLQLLLRTPHELQWQKLGVLGSHFNAEAAGLLASLPTLTDLTVESNSSLELLQHVPNLRTLQLSDFNPCDLTPEQMIAPVGQLTQLTHLVLSYGAVRSNQMCALLSRMPALSKLELDGVYRLESLRFLSDSEQLARTFTSLSITGCYFLPAAELQRLLSLTQLSELTLEAAVTGGIDPKILQELQVPSSRLPKLVKFSTK